MIFEYINHSVAFSILDQRMQDKMEVGALILKDLKLISTNLLMILHYNKYFTVKAMIADMLTHLPISF